MGEGYARAWHCAMLRAMLMHDGQLTISIAAVRELLRLQFPQWQSLPVRAVASDGTVNAIFRIGARLAARFPLQPADVAATRQWLESEASAARRLIGRTRFRTPEPVAIGEPGAGYPLPWSVQTWLPGTVATEQDQSRSVTFARDLAALVGEVRAIDIEGRTFAGTNRGGDLRSRDAWMEECFTRSEQTDGQLAVIEIGGDSHKREGPPLHHHDLRSWPRRCSGAKAAGKST
jgi:aminoglycoside phosphotransferase (APT) family kinase protein